MTSSVFGGITARNFGYAKVEIKQSIARHDGQCEVCIYTNPNAAKDRSGIEYTDTTPVKEMQDINELHSRIEQSMQQIHLYPWPGNIRELENVLERSILFATGQEMTNLDLEMPVSPSNTNEWKDIKEYAIAKVEQSFLERSLKQHKGDIKKTAEDMGITTRAVYTKLKKYDINLMDYRRT